jgi:hypothetical protein
MTSTVTASDATGTPESWAGMPVRPDVVVLIAERHGRPVGYVSAVRRLHLRFGAEILALDDLFVVPRWSPCGRPGPSE